MERLIIVIECPDDWREGDAVTPQKVQAAVTKSLPPSWQSASEPLAVRVRWGTV